MRNRFLYIFMVVAFALPAYALDPEFSEIVSYTKLMSLSPAQRVEYIRQVRLMVTEFEEVQRNLADDPTAVADARERNDLLDLMLNEAQAQAVRGGSLSPGWWARQEQARSGMLVWSTPRLTNAQLYQAVYRCPYINNLAPNIARSVNQKSAALSCPSPGFQCPIGYRQITSLQKTHKKVCYRDLRPQPQPQAKRAPPKPKAVAAAQPAKPRRPAASAEQPRSRRARTPAPRDAEADTDGAIAGTTAVETEPDEVTTGLPDYEVGSEQIFPWRNGDDERFRSAQTEGVTCKDEPDFQDPLKFPTATCDDTIIKNARAEYYRDNKPHCLFGGNLRHYRNSQRRPGQCMLPREFCLSNVECRKPDNSLINPAETTRMKCEQGKIICNPLIFNTDLRNNPLCVSPSKNATAACAEMAEKIDNDLKAKGQQMTPFITRIVIGGRENAQNAIALNGLQESWNNFAKEINSICNESPSKNLYCRECAILKTRVAKLNLLAFIRGDRKPDANGNCYQLKDQLVPKTEPAGGSTNQPAPSNR